MPSKFIPHKQNQIRKHAMTGKRPAGDPFTITLQLLKMKLKEKSGRDGERFTLYWDYPNNEFTLTNYFKEGDPVILKQQILETNGELFPTSTASKMSQMFLENIKGNLKKFNFEKINSLLLECNFITLNISATEVKFFNKTGEKKIWKG